MMNIFIILYSLGFTKVPLPQSKEDLRIPSSILTRDRHMLLSLKGHSMVGVLSPEEKKVSFQAVACWFFHHPERE